MKYLGATVRKESWTKGKRRRKDIHSYLTQVGSVIESNKPHHLALRENTKFVGSIIQSNVRNVIVSMFMFITFNATDLTLIQVRP